MPAGDSCDCSMQPFDGTTYQERPIAIPSSRACYSMVRASGSRNSQCSDGCDWHKKSCTSACTTNSRIVVTWLWPNGHETDLFSIYHPRSEGAMFSVVSVCVFVCSGVDPGGEGGGRSPNKNTGARVSFRPLNVLAFSVVTYTL